MSDTKRQHYLPASHIGRFSTDRNKRLRERSVWVCRTGQHTPFQTKAQSVGLKKNIYTLSAKSNYNAYHIDRSWGHVEGKLPNAITELTLSTGNLFNLHTWATVLVPFVAQIFVRTPAWEKHYQVRTPWLGRVFEDTKEYRDNVNYARLMDFQANCGFLINAQWKLRFTDTPLILNDVGFVPFEDMGDGTTGYAVPLTSHMLLMVAQRHTETVDISYDKNRRAIYLPRDILALNEVDSFNKYLSRFAHDEIYGSSPEIVNTAWHARSVEGKVEFPLGSDLLIPEGKDRLDWMNEYYRFLKHLGIPMDVITGSLGGNYMLSLNRLGD